MLRTDQIAELTVRRYTLVLMLSLFQCLWLANEPPPASSHETTSEVPLGVLGASGSAGWRH
jgi:hypothetical protein